MSIINIANETPSVAQLQSYAAVLVYSDSPRYNDAVALGDNLADYVDSGGGVVTAVFADASIPIEGRFHTDNYWAIEPSGQTQGTEQFIGTRFVPSHPILTGVASFSGGTSSYRTTTLNIASGLAQQGKKILVIDLDPQGGCAVSLGISVDSLRKVSMTY